MRLTEIAKHTSVYSLASIGQSAASFLLLPLYVKFFSPAEYGEYTLLLMIISIGTSVFYLGVNSALPSSYFENSEPLFKRRVFSTAMTISFVGSISLFIFGWLFQHELSSLLFEGKGEQRRILAVCGTGSLIILNQLMLNLFRIKLQTAFVAFSGLAGVVTTLLSTYYLVAFRNWGIDAPIFASLIVQLITFIFYIFAARNSLSLSFDTEQAKKMLKFGFPTILISIGVMTVEWSDRLILQHLLSTEDVGVYSLGFRIGAIVTPLIITPLAQVWIPMAFNHRQKGDYEFVSGELVSVFITMGLCLTFAAQLFASTVFNLFLNSPVYQSSTLFIPFIIAGNFLNGLNNFVTFGAIFERKLGRLVLNSYFLAALSALMNYLFIRNYESIGAAFTFLVVNTISPILTYMHARKFQKIRFNFELLYRVALTTSVFFFGDFLLPWPNQSVVVLFKFCYFSLFIFIIYNIFNHHFKQGRKLNIGLDA